MAVTVNEASAVLRAAVRDTIRKRSMLFLIQGGVMVLAGVVALIFPAITSLGLLALLGWLLILSGVVQILSLIGATQVPYFWLQLVSVVLEVLVGYLLVSNPAAGLMAVTFLMLVLFLVGGIARVVFALMIRPMQDWLWLLASGLVAVACALVLFASLPQAASWLLGLLLGVQLDRHRRGDGPDRLAGAAVGLRQALEPAGRDGVRIPAGWWTEVDDAKRMVGRRGGAGADGVRLARGGAARCGDRPPGVARRRRAAAGGRRDGDARPGGSGGGAGPGVARGVLPGGLGLLHRRVRHAGPAADARLWRRGAARDRQLPGG